MIDALYTLLQKLTGPKRVWIFFGCFIVASTLINGEPFGVAQLKSISGGVGMLDMEIGYSPQEAYALFDALGEKGRAFYLRSLVPQDLVFPLVYSLFFMTAATFLFQGFFSEESPWQKLSVLTVAAGMFDYLENFCVLVMLLAYPQQLTVVAGLANIFTLAKFGFFALNIVLLLLGLAGLVVKKFSGAESR